MNLKKFEIFIKLMGMTTSDNEGEALVALRKANALLMESNLNWEEVLRGKVQVKGGDESTQVSGKQYTNPEIDQMLEAVGRNARGSFKEFVMSLQEWWDDKGFLTEKQYNALRKSYEKV